MGLDMYLSAKRILTPDTAQWGQVQHLFPVPLGEDGEPHFVSGYDFGPDPRFEPLATIMGVKPTPDSPSFWVGLAEGGGIEVSWSVLYWRKANAIHRWFVDNAQNGVDDCGEYLTHSEVLVGLVTLCRQVLADHSLASDLLPTQSGFFFGDTEYDEWYFEDLRRTEAELSGLLVSPLTRGVTFSYQSSW
jgi:hypothetical protein